MKITQVSVSYGELRSKDFSNKRIEVGYTANIEEYEMPNEVKAFLLLKAKNAVKQQFDIIERGLDGE